MDKLVACQTCGLVQEADDVPKGSVIKCARCHFQIFHRRVDSRVRTLAFSIAALILYYPYIESNHEKWNDFTPGEKKWDHHLRSSHEVTGYHIQTEDGELGHVEDFIIDDETWAIRYLIVNTSNWWAGKKVLVSPQWIERVNWGQRKVFVNLSRETIKQSPEYTEESLLNRDYEIGLHGHYNRKGY